MEMNLLGILIAAIFYMVVGAIWYSPNFFGKEWASLTKVSLDSNKDAGKTYIGAFINALVMSWVLSLAIDYAGAFSTIGGGIIGFFMWLGFVATTEFSRTLWENRPWKLFFLNAGCMLITLIVMGVVIGGLA